MAGSAAEAVGHNQGADGAEPIRPWNPRYETLDVWRGLACLMVVLHHAAYCLEWSETEGTGVSAWLRWLTVLAASRMKLGVTLFFVISGYCIAASADASRRRSGSPWGFLARRFWRIYPPYWAAIVFFAIVTVGLDSMGHAQLYEGTRAVGLDHPSALAPSQWLGNLTLTETWRPHVGGPARNVFTVVAWSLCFEEQFYFVCFLALWLAPRRLVGALATITATLVALRAGAWAMGMLPRLSGVFPLLWHEFAVGLAVYYRLNLARTRASRLGIDAGLLTMVVVGLLTGGRDTAVAAAFGLTLVALRRWDGRASELAWLAPLRACGRRCYSVYLAHLPVCVVGTAALVDLGLQGFWARALVVIPLISMAAVAVSWMFFDVVELRFLKPPADWARRVMGRPGPVHPALPGSRTPVVVLDLTGRAAWVRAGVGVRGGAP